MSLRRSRNPKFLDLVEYKAKYPRYTLPDTNRHFKKIDLSDQYRSVKVKKPGRKRPAFINLMRTENVEYMLDQFKTR